MRGAGNVADAARAAQVSLSGAGPCIAVQRHWPHKGGGGPSVHRTSAWPLPGALREGTRTLPAALDTLEMPLLHRGVRHSRTLPLMTACHPLRRTRVTGAERGRERTMHVTGPSCALHTCTRTHTIPGVDTSSGREAANSDHPRTGTQGRWGAQPFPSISVCTAPPPKNRFSTPLCVVSECGE